MANTYTQIIIQIVFAVKFHERLISETHREEYLNLLNKFDIDHNDEYLFDWLEKFSTYGAGNFWKIFFYRHFAPTELVVVS